MAQVSVFMVIDRGVIDSRQVDALLNETLSIVASIRPVSMRQNQQKLPLNYAAFGDYGLTCTMAVSRKYTQKLLSGQAVDQSLTKKTAAILFYCAHHVRSTFWDNV